MVKILKLVLTDHWFEEIKSGRKTHEYRKATPFWYRRLLEPMRLVALCNSDYPLERPQVQFQKAYRKNPERMTFEINKINIIDGEYTDLKCVEDVFDIELGDRIDVAED